MSKPASPEGGSFPYQETPDTRSVEDLRRENAVLRLENGAKEENLADLKKLADVRGLLVDKYKEENTALKEQLEALRIRESLCFKLMKRKKVKALQMN